MEEKYFKGQRQAYINYANRTLVGIIQHLYDDHGTISPMDIVESKHKMKQEWSLLDPMVDLFEQIEEGVDFAEAANTPIPGGKLVNIAWGWGVSSFCKLHSFFNLFKWVHHWV